MTTIAASLAQGITNGLRTAAYGFHKAADGLHKAADSLDPSRPTYNDGPPPAYTSTREKPSFALYVIYNVVHVTIGLAIVELLINLGVSLGIPAWLTFLGLMLCAYNREVF